MDTELDILERAASAFSRMDKIKQESRLIEAEVRSLCSEYSQVMRIWGYRPEMLRMAVEARLGRQKYG